jgi:hypothetical protein
MHGHVLGQRSDVGGSKSQGRRSSEGAAHWFLIAKQMIRSGKQWQVLSIITNLGKMVDTEELVALRTVMDMVEIVMDKVGGVRSAYKLEVTWTMWPDQELCSTLGLFAIVRDDQMNWAMHIELVERHRICPKRVDIEDRLTNGTLVRCEKRIQVEKLPEISIEGCCKSDKTRIGHSQGKIPHVYLSP